jgi:lipopolysaccharide export system permease protein
MNLMNRIDRYVLGLFWTYFLSALIVFVTLFLAIDALSTLVQYRGLLTSSIVRYYLFFAPEIIQKMLPVACLLGTVLTLSSLNKGNELVALYASGMSLLRISIPILLSVSAISAGFFLGADRLMPTLTREKNFVYYNEIEKKPGKYSVIKTNRIWYRSKNAIFNIKTLNPQESRAQGLTMYFFNDDWDLVQMLTAKRVDFDGKQWKLLDGTVTIFSAESSFPMSSQFQSKSLMMSEDTQDLKNTGQTSEVLSQKELLQFIDKNREAGLDTIRYEVDYHAKFGFACAGLVMSLLGIPFSVSRGRSAGMMLNLGLCIGLVFGYWVLYSSALTLGSHGTLPPLAAAWSPNLIMAAAALFMLKRLGF